MTDLSLLHTEAAAATGSGARDAAAPVLALPEGWVIDELVRDRLSHQLTRAPDEVTGVVAESGSLPSGASYRVHAERLGLRPLSEATPTRDNMLRGAALLRPGTAYELRDDGIEVEERSLLIDAGAHVHDPWRQPAPLQDASALGRPPFPRRPVVLFLACEPDVEPLDWARSIVNNLVRRDVEGRLAMFDIADGLHLTQPCSPTEQSVHALRPDIIVALDEQALDRASVWARDDRSTVIVAFTPDIAATAEIIPWQLDRAKGRLRARIGRQIDAPTLVSLVNRLCSGPHPSPPNDTPHTRGATATVRAVLNRSTSRQPEPAVKRSIVVVTDGTERSSAGALDGLIDHLIAAGHASRLCSLATGGSSIRDADVAVLSSASGDHDLLDLIAARRRSGRPTIANIEVGDVEGLSDRAPRLEPIPERLIASCGRATTGSTAVCALLSEQGVHVYSLPPLLTRAFAAELRTARRPNGVLPGSVMAWNVGSRGTPPPNYVDAVAEAVLELLTERINLQVDVVGDPSHVPEPVLAHPRVRVVPDRPGPDAMSGWSLQLWTPPLLDSGVADDVRPLVETSSLGVPTVLSMPIEAAIDGCPSRELLIDAYQDADSWAGTVRSLLDDELTWSTRSREAARYFDSMHGATASEVAANRFLGWALARDATP